MAQAQDMIFENPVLPPAVTQMKIDVLVNEAGKVWVAYDTPFAQPVQWVEYDVDLNTLIFIMGGGRMQEFGISINPKMAKVLALARSAWLVRMANKKIEDLGEVPLLVRKSGFEPWGEA